MNKKGQAAMEFLMTYGWAILVVIAAIAALAYFGVLDPARLLPERCQSSAGMDCIDKASIRTDGLTFALRNNIGFGIEVTDIALPIGSVYVCTGEEVNDVAIAGSFNVSNNEVMRVGFTTCTGAPAAGDKFDEAVVVSYKNKESGLANQVSVDIRGRVVQ